MLKHQDSMKKPPGKVVKPGGFCYGKYVAEATYFVSSGAEDWNIKV